MANEEGAWEAIKKSATVFILVCGCIPLAITLLLVQLFGVDPFWLIFVYGIPAVASGSLLALLLPMRKEKGREEAEFAGAVAAVIAWLIVLLGVSPS